MRYAKGGLVINPERDIPLLRQVRNSRFVSHNQLFELMKFGGSDRSRDSFNWRVRRLIKSGHISFCGGVFCAGSAVYRITKEGLILLEHHGQFTTVLHSNTQHLSHASQVFHALELNAIQIALAHGSGDCFLQYDFAVSLREGLRRHSRRMGRRCQSTLRAGI